MYGCQQLLLKYSNCDLAVLKYICTESNTLFNCGTYLARQLWFKRRRKIGKFALNTEESYTSQASFADNDFLPTYGEKPESWKSSGKRIKRGIIERRKDGWSMRIAMGQRISCEK